MHDGGGVCWRWQSRVLVGTRAVDSMAFTSAMPASPSCLVGLDGVDVLEVEVERMVGLGVDVAMIL